MGGSELGGGSFRREIDSGSLGVKIDSVLVDGGLLCVEMVGCE